MIPIDHQLSDLKAKMNRSVLSVLSTVVVLRVIKTCGLKRMETLCPEPVDPGENNGHSGEETTQERKQSLALVEQFALNHCTKDRLYPVISYIRQSVDIKNKCEDLNSWHYYTQILKIVVVGCEAYKTLSLFKTLHLKMLPRSFV